jgi:hypothetical protein
MVVGTDRARPFDVDGREEASARITVPKYQYIQRLWNFLFVRWRIPG